MLISLHISFHAPDFSGPFNIYGVHHALMGPHPSYLKFFSKPFVCRDALSDEVRVYPFTVPKKLCPKEEIEFDAPEILLTPDHAAAFALTLILSDMAVVGEHPLLPHHLTGCYDYATRALPQEAARAHLAHVASHVTDLIAS